MGNSQSQYTHCLNDDGFYHKFPYIDQYDHIKLTKIDLTNGSIKESILTDNYIEILSKIQRNNISSFLITEIYDKDNQLINYYISTHEEETHT